MSDVRINLQLKSTNLPQNDPEFADFISDLRLVKEGGKPDFKTYTSYECRKSLCWTNKTRRLINNKWMLEESRIKKIIVVYLLDYPLS